MRGRPTSLAARDLPGVARRQCERWRWLHVDQCRRDVCDRQGIRRSLRLDAVHTILDPEERIDGVLIRLPPGETELRTASQRTGVQLLPQRAPENGPVACELARVSERTKQVIASFSCAPLEPCRALPQIGAGPFECARHRERGARTRTSDRRHTLERSVRQHPGRECPPVAQPYGRLGVPSIECIARTVLREEQTVAQVVRVDPNHGILAVPALIQRVRTLLRREPFVSRVQARVFQNSVFAAHRSATRDTTRCVLVLREQLRAIAPRNLR